LAVSPVLGTFVLERDLVDRSTIDGGELADGQGQHVELLTVDSCQRFFKASALVVLQVQGEPVRCIRWQLLPPSLQQRRGDDREQQQHRLSWAVPQVPRGEAADEQDRSHARSARNPGEGARVPAAARPYHRHSLACHLVPFS